MSLYDRENYVNEVVNNWHHSLQKNFNPVKPCPEFQASAWLLYKIIFLKIDVMNTQAITFSNIAWENAGTLLFS